MARPEIPEEKYIDAINALISDGLAIEAIRPVKLQQVVGGRYSRCSDMLDKFKVDYLEQEEPGSKQPQPPWFKEMVGTTSEYINNSLTSTWFIIHGEINKAIEVATQAYELKKEEFIEQQKDDRAQIDLLENQIDSLNSQLEAKEKELKNSDTLHLQEKTSLENELVSANKDVVKYKAIADERGESLKSLNHELQSSADTNSHLCSVNKQQMKDIEDFEIVVTGLKEELKSHELKAEKSSLVNESLREKLELQEAQFINNQDEYKKQFQKFTDTEQENSELKLDNIRLSERCDNFNNSMESANKKTEQLQNKLVNLAQNNQKMKK